MSGHAVQDIYGLSFETVTGITEDVTASEVGDTLTLESGNELMSIVGDAEEKKIVFTVDPVLGSHLHDGQTLQFDGLNSDGGPFSFSTSGPVTFNQSVSIQGSTLNLGQEDLLAGGMNLFGHDAGSKQGGKIRLDMAADYDATYIGWYMEVWEDDLLIHRNGYNDLKLTPDGDLYVGSGTIVLADLTAGYLPYQTAAGLANSLVYTDGTNIRMWPASGGTYNGNIYFQYGDQYPAVFFRGGTTSKAGVFGDVNVGHLYLDAFGTANSSDILLRAERYVYIQDYNGGDPATRFTFDVINGYLTLAGSAVVYASGGFYNAAGTAGWNHGTGAQFAIRTNGSDNRVIVTTSGHLVVSPGYLGIGIDPPGAPLHIASNAQAYVRIESDLDGTPHSWYLGSPEAADRFVIDETSVASGTMFVILTTTGYTGFGTLNPLSQVHVYSSTTSSTVRIESDNGGAGVYIDGTAGQYRAVDFRTAGSLRWYMVADNTAESGSNVGSDFVLFRYSDAGAYLGSAFAVTRSTGHFGIRVNPAACPLEIEDGGTGASMVVKITQDDAAIYGLIIGNDTYSTTDTLGLAFFVGNTGSGYVRQLGAGDLCLDSTGTANTSDIYLRSERYVYVADWNAGTPATKFTFDVINGRLGIQTANMRGQLTVGNSWPVVIQQNEGWLAVELPAATSSFAGNAYYDSGWKYRLGGYDAWRMVMANSFGISSAPVGALAADPVTFSTRLYITHDGLVCINDTANTKMTQGLTIYQGANDDEILALKSSDVGHSMAFTEADTYGYFYKVGASVGGLGLVGLSDADSTGLQISGVIGSNNPTDTMPAVVIQGGKWDAGTSWTALGSLETVFQLRNYNSNLITVLGAGWVGMGTAVPLEKLDVRGNALFGTGETTDTNRPTSYVCVSATNEGESAGFYMYVPEGTNNYRGWVKVDDSNATLAIGATYSTGTSPSIYLQNNTGIATANPVARLEVEDGGTTASMIVKITQDDGNVYGLVIGNDTYSTTDVLGLRFFLRNAGNGVIENGAAGDIEITALGTANTSDIYLRSERYVYIQDYNGGTPATKFTFDVINGNVGIGVSPSHKLDVYGGAIAIRNNIVAAHSTTYSTIYSTENTGAAYPFTGTSGNLVLEPRSGQDLVMIGTSGAVRMIVQGSGNVGVGVTPLVAFHVFGNAYPFMLLDGSSGTSSFIGFRVNTQSDSNVNVFWCADGNLIFNSQAYANRGTASGETARMYLTPAGDLFLPTGTISCSDLTANYIPYQTAGGLANSVIYQATSRIAIGHDAPNATTKVDILGTSYFQLYLTETKTDSTLNRTGIVAQHYTAAEEPLGLIHGRVDATTAEVALGGYTSMCNAATKISFYTAANNTTTNGTERMHIDGTGNIGISRSALKTWSAGYVAMQIGGVSSIYSHASQAAGVDFYIGHNAYYNSAWKAIVTDEAALVQFYNGAITFKVSNGVVTADADITWRDAIYIGNTGTVALGATATAGTGLLLRTITSGAAQYGIMSDSQYMSGTTQSNMIYAGGMLAASVTCAEWAGLRIDAPGKQAPAGTITTLYGLYLANMAAGSTNWSIYSNGGNSYFAGNIAVGSGSSPTVAMVDIYSGAVAYPALQVARSYDGGRVRFKYSTYTDAYGEIGQTYSAAGKTKIWMGANLNTFNAAHEGATQGNAGGASWYIVFDTISDLVALNRIAAGGVTSATAWLQISGTGNTYLRAIGTANTSDMFFDAERYVYIRDNNGGTPATKFTFDVINGRLLVGGSSAPTYTIQTGATSQKIGYYSDATHYNSIEFYNSSTGGMVFDVEHASSGVYNFQFNGSDLVFITTGGELIVNSGHQFTLRNAANNKEIKLQNTGASGVAEFSIVHDGTTALFISGGRNIGIGTTDIEAWSGSFKVIEFPRTAIMAGGGNDLYFLANAYYDGNWKRKEGTDLCEALILEDGALSVLHAGAGVVDSVITWKTAIALASDATFTVGYTSGGTYNGNYRFNASDNAPTLYFRSGTTIRGYIQYDIANQQMFLESSTGTNLYISAFGTVNTSDIYLRAERYVYVQDYNGGAPLTAGGWDVINTILYVGRNDAQRGAIYLYGSGTGTGGGQLTLFLGADHDASIDYFQIAGYQDDLLIGHSGDSDIVRIAYEKDVYLTAGSLVLPASEYVNFGGTQGTGGYGIFDDAGTMKYKDSGGTWIALNSLGGGSGGWTDDGTVVRLSTASDQVAIGTATARGRLRVLDNGVSGNSVLHITQDDAGVYGLVIANSTAGDAQDYYGLKFQYNNSSQGYITCGSSSYTNLYIQCADLYLVTCSLVLSASEYVNFGGTQGTGGYGIFDDAGTMKYKNSGGSWVAFSSILGATEVSSSLKLGTGSGSAWSSTTYSVAIGQDASKYGDGSSNTTLGWGAGRGVSGNNYSNFTALGAAAGYSVTTAEFTTLVGCGAGYRITSGSSNTAMGFNALEDLTTGSNCSAFGKSALGNATGNGNSGFGSGAGGIITSGTYNTCVGDSANLSSATATNRGAFGYSATSDADNKIVIGNSSVTSIGGYANWSNYSDISLKVHFQPLEPAYGRDFLLMLQPRRYFHATKKIWEEGFVAQEVKWAADCLDLSFSGWVAPGEHGLQMLAYEKFVVPLVAGFQQHDIIIQEHDDEITRLRAQVAELKARVEYLEAA